MGCEFLAILRPFWGWVSEFTWPKQKKVVGDLQGLGIKRSRPESPGSFFLGGLKYWENLVASSLFRRFQRFDAPPKWSPPLGIVFNISTKVTARIWISGHEINCLGANQRNHPKNPQQTHIKLRFMTFFSDTWRPFGKALGDSFHFLRSFRDFWLSCLGLLVSLHLGEFDRWEHHGLVKTFLLSDYPKNHWTIQILRVHPSWYDSNTTE